jgi:NADH-quinone oxidoreductase subunit M
MQHLALLFLLPFISSLAVLVCSFVSPGRLKRVAFALSLLPLAVLLINHSDWIGTHIEYDWLPALSVKFYLSVDALSLLFLYLVAIVVPIALMSVRSRDVPHANFFYALVLFLQGILIGFFTARDLALFTLLWEAMLLPLYFIVTLWGGPGRREAATTFLIYMLAGSALMVAAVLSLYFSSVSINGTGTFSLDKLAEISSQLPHASWLAAVFFLAFAVKTPLFPFHAWLPDVYSRASTAGTILLAAVLSKAGIYGFFRIGMELFPRVMKEWGALPIGLAVAGVLYGGLAAWWQNDFKRLLAYSSFSHVNFILAGIFVMNQTAETGAILQTLNHAATIAGLFLVAGWLQERLGSTSIEGAGGLCMFLPKLCWLTVIFVLSAVAVPGFNNFVGELLIFVGLFRENPWIAAMLVTSVVLSVIYMLKWLQKMYFEQPGAFQDSWLDIGPREIALAIPLVFYIFWIGVYPAFMLKQIEPATEKMIGMVQSEHSQ